MSEPGGSTCRGCRRPLADGVRFCVACGTHNFDADTGKLAESTREMKLHENRKFWEKFRYWWRYLTVGLRR